ncbi:hypothetical protein GQX74_000651 [Glossina fuscipes]|nr:hypothetical protein GQX74_000651 [Glossina fuscipes]
MQGPALLVAEASFRQSNECNKISLENFHNFINNFCLPLLARTVVIENVAHEGFEDTALYSCLILRENFAVVVGADAGFDRCPPSPQHFGAIASILSTTTTTVHYRRKTLAGTVELFIPPIIPPAGVCVEFDWPNVDDVDAEALALLIIRSPRSLIKSHIPLHFSEIAASVWKDPTVAYCESKSLAEMLTTVSEGNIIKFGTDLISSGAFLLDLMHDGNSRATSKPCENTKVALRQRADTTDLVGPLWVDGKL